MRIEPRARSVGGNMSIRRHIGNPEVRARSGSESRRGRAHQKSLHVSRDEQAATSTARKEGSSGREEGSAEGREAGRAWGPRSRAFHPVPQAARARAYCPLAFVAQRSELPKAKDSPFPQRAYSLGVAVT